MNDWSRRTLRLLPLEPGDISLYASKLRLQGGLHTRRPPVSVRYLGNVCPPDSELGGDPAVQPSCELFPVNEAVHLSFSKRNKGSRGDVPPESEEYSQWTNLVKKKIQKVLVPKEPLSLGERMHLVRKDRGLNQTQLGELLGVAQSHVAKWERGALQIPSAALVKMSELVPAGPERQWWRDEAAKRAGFMEDAQSGPKNQFANATLFRTIPLVKNPLKVGELGQMDVADVMENLQLPQHWFAEGGTIRAAIIKDNPLSPLIAAGEYIAIIDVSRRDPDRLVDCVVATRTPTGIEARMLRKDRNVYFLQPLFPSSGSVPRILKHDGEDSIVGQVLKWIADAPSKAPNVN